MINSWFQAPLNYFRGSTLMFREFFIVPMKITTYMVSPWHFEFSIIIPVKTTQVITCIFDRALNYYISATASCGIFLLLLG